MDNLFSVQIFESTENIFEYFYGSGLTKLSFLFDKSSKITFLTELSNNVHIVAGLINIHKFDNILMVNFLHDIYFRLNWFNIVIIGEYFLIDNFDSHWEIISYTSTQIHSSIGTLTYRFIQRENIFLDFLLPFL